MKKEYLLLVCLLIILPSVANGVFEIKDPIEATTFSELLDLFLEWIKNIALALAPLVIVYGGFLHITAAGKPEQSSQGKKVILYGAIGLMVVLLADSLLEVVKGFIDKK